MARTARSKSRRSRRTGQYTIEALADGYGRRSVEINPQDSKDHRDDTGLLKLLLAKLSITGVVVDPNDKPVQRLLSSAEGRANRPSPADGCRGQIHDPGRLSGADQLDRELTRAEADVRYGASRGRGHRSADRCPPMVHGPVFDAGGPAAPKGQPLPSWKDLRIAAAGQ